MKVSIQISRFNFSDTTNIAPTLTSIAQAADDAGFSTLTVMDHYFQIGYAGPYTDPMMEAYTTLGFIAGVTKRIKLGTMVTGVIYRHPAYLVKQVSALDVLSSGRAFLGIGAGWNEEETTALGFPFPPVAERFELLEETLQIAKLMWSDSREGKKFSGKHFTLENAYNNPQPITKPHPRILIGGGGEQKTLLFVAKYADAWNFFAGAGEGALMHKLKVLRKHCETVKRNYDEISKTLLYQPPKDLNPKEVLKDLASFAQHGIDEVFFNRFSYEDIPLIQKIGKEIIPAAKEII